MMPVVVGMSGASGAVYGIRLLEVLRGLVETHLIVTEWGRKTIETETSHTVAEVLALASSVHDDTDLADPLASGSFRTAGMVVIPCSIRTLSAVANSHSATLLQRAADVTLKERRKLILCIRETPLHLGHVRLMASAAEAGAVLLPLIPAFYSRPRTVEEIVDHSVGRVLDLLEIEHHLYRRWEGHR